MNFNFFYIFQTVNYKLVNGFFVSKLKIIKKKVVKNLILFKKVTYICIGLIVKTRNYGNSIIKKLE